MASSADEVNVRVLFFGKARELVECEETSVRLPRVLPYNKLKELIFTEALASAIRAMLRKTADTTAGVRNIALAQTSPSQLGKRLCAASTRVNFRSLTAKFIYSVHHRIAVRNSLSDATTDVSSVNSIRGHISQQPGRAFHAAMTNTGRRSLRRGEEMCAVAVCEVFVVP
ncbi:unnamed protein product [Heligmosomoides polygyrus]|uniref:Uncharacterized protein n=1 Tax=Heligmosomoides polygyrus TaxID=6339 RepID=A0A183GSK3_HELPZ|nr:unnamed protein product [Heligmosomoides polygyrus]